MTSSGTRSPGLIVNFHGVGVPIRSLDSGESKVWVSKDEMNAILDLVADRSDVYITSDDGNISDLAELMPAMIERSLTGTFFILSDRIGEPGSLAESDIQELIDGGMRIGLHGAAHVPWRNMTDDQKCAEWSDAIDRLQQISGREIDEAACPFGIYDRSVVKGLRKMGMQKVFTSDRGWAPMHDFVIPRNSVGTGHPNIGAQGLKRLLDNPRIDLKDRAKRWIKRWR